jgi:hypothetical protein
MPWIKIIPEHEAEGELKEVYKKIREQRKGERINQVGTRVTGARPSARRCCTASIPRRCGIRPS